MPLTSFATRARPAAVRPSAVTAFNKPELKKIVDTMKGFGFNLTDKEEESSAGYYATLYFDHKSEDGPLIQLLTTRGTGNVFNTKLDVEIGSGADINDTFGTVGELNSAMKKLSKSLAVSTDLLKAVEFLSQYVGKAKAPKA